MKATVEIKQRLINKRKLRVRKHLQGTSDRPRLSVFRSQMHIYAQVIDDEAGVTLAASSSIAKHMRGSLKELSNKEQARKVGEDIAMQATRLGVDAVVFDRGPYKFHGRVKELAEAAREHGLAF